MHRSQVLDNMEALNKSRVEGISATAAVGAVSAGGGGGAAGGRLGASGPGGAGKPGAGRVSGAGVVTAARLSGCASPGMPHRCPCTPHFALLRMPCGVTPGSHMW